MKASYTEKAKLLPEGFKPRKRRSKAAADDDDAAPKTVKEETNASSQSSPSRDQDQAPVKIENDSLESSAARRVSESDNQAKSLVKQESKRRLSSTSDLSKGQEKSSVLPPKPKKFSVMDFMRKKKDPSRESISSVTGIDKIVSPASRGTSEKKAIPSWVTAPPPSSFDSFAGSDRREDRLFALEFLLQAAAHFPAGKGVNEESVARGLEMAVYEWSEKQNSWSDSYWDKIHSVVAAITGKREVGSIVSMIMDGHFASPKAIVALSDENLEHSFEGRPFELE
jgi:hypothetical protein